jgi:hypothetical protein
MKIYKFRSYAEKSRYYTARLLRFSELYFARPDELNDPFEIWANYDFTASDSKKFEFWSQNPEISAPFTGWSDSQKLKYIADIERQLNRPSFQDNFFRKNLGIFSASTSWTNLVMWSHYGDSHGALCVEVDTDLDTKLPAPVSVTYNTNVASHTFYSDENQSIIPQFFSHKFSDWSYENEVRLFHNPGVFKLSPEAVTAVMFGLNAKRNWKTTKCFVWLARRYLPNAKFYFVKRDPETYDLIREEITGLLL